MWPLQSCKNVPIGTWMYWGKVIFLRWCLFLGCPHSTLHDEYIVMRKFPQVVSTVRHIQVQGTNMMQYIFSCKGTISIPGDFKSIQPNPLIAFGAKSISDSIVLLVITNKNSFQLYSKYASLSFTEIPCDREQSCWKCARCPSAQLVLAYSEWSIRIFILLLSFYESMYR